MPADQSRFVATTFGLTEVGVVAFECSLGQMLAVYTVGELAREVVILEHRSQLTVEAAFKLQARFLKS